MPAISDHDGLLDELLKSFRVFLLNRYEDDGLGFQGDTIRVFLPDLHWISQADMARFPKYHFNGMTLMPLLFDVLEKVATLGIYQTGDRIDFWRASTPRHATPEETYDSILADAQIKDLHDRLRAFEAK